MGKETVNMLNINEAKDILSYVIDNNRKLRENNKKATALEIIGESGLGKTSMIMQVAEDLGIKCVKLNLALLEELGD